MRHDSTSYPMVALADELGVPYALVAQTSRVVRNARLGRCSEPHEADAADTLYVSLGVQKFDLVIQRITRNLKSIGAIL